MKTALKGRLADAPLSLTRRESIMNPGRWCRQGRIDLLLLVPVVLLGGCGATSGRPPVDCLGIVAEYVTALAPARACDPSAASSCAGGPLPIPVYTADVLSGMCFCSTGGGDWVPIPNKAALDEIVARFVRSCGPVDVCPCLSGTSPAPCLATGPSTYSCGG